MLNGNNLNEAGTILLLKQFVHEMKSSNQRQSGSGFHRIQSLNPREREREQTFIQNELSHQKITIYPIRSFDAVTHKDIVRSSSANGSL